MQLQTCNACAVGCVSPCGTRLLLSLQALCQDNLVTSDTDRYSNERVVDAPLSGVDQAESVETPAVLNQDHGDSINTASPARSLQQVSSALWQAGGIACVPCFSLALLSTLPHIAVEEHA